VIGQYHARGVVPLRRRSLRLCEMTADRPPWEGTVTVPSLPSSLEVQCHVAQAIGRSTYSWPPSRLLPMLADAGIEKVVSCWSSRCILFAFFVTSIFLKLVFPGFPSHPLAIVVEVRPPRSGQGASPGGGDFQPEQGRGGEAARREQGAAQEMPDRQARSKRQPHQEAEGRGAWCLLR
jgi:hypothetical protein